MRRTTAKDIGRLVGIADLAIPGVALSVLAVWMLRSVPAPAATSWLRAHCSWRVRLRTVNRGRCTNPRILKTLAET